MVKTRSAAPEGQDFIISSLPPSPAQRRLALGVVLALMAAFVVVAGPLSNVPLARIDAFVPMYGMAMFVNDSITAVLLFAQFSILRSHALLAISSGYLFTALILIPWVLTFPGVFAPGGLLGAGPQSTGSLYVVWHAGFPLFVIAYALLKKRPHRERSALHCAPARSSTGFVHSSGEGRRNTSVWTSTTSSERWWPCWSRRRAAMPSRSGPDLPSVCRRRSPIACRYSRS